MNEYFLQYLWNHALIDFCHLNTTDGQPVSVINRGVLNVNAGPDFLNAKIRIGATIWVGHVEIHLKTSLWKVHGHHYDEKYKNVILHVVYEDDEQGALAAIPLVEIKNRFDADYWHQYQDLMLQPYDILCHKYLPKVPSIILEKLKEDMLLTRWNDKFTLLSAAWSNNAGDWKQLVYLTLGRTFGFKINQDGFDVLVRHTPLHILEKHKDNLFQLEAILMGQAQLIPQDFQDAYTQKLEKEYHFLRRKYGIVPMNRTHWNFSRLRPANFPTIRIAQFAHFLYQIQFDFEQLLKNYQDYEQFLKKMDIKTSSYFKDHYRLSDQSMQSKEKKLGLMGIRLLIINAIAPLKYWYDTTFKIQHENSYDDAFAVLMQLPAEVNATTKKWPLVMNNAFDTQSAIQLINEKCTKKQCLSCPVGNFILKKQ